MIIGGDLVPTKSNFELFKNGDIDELIGINLKERMLTVDYRILNLEVPLTDKENQIDKNGPNLIAPTYTINGIKRLNPSLLSLANNHILDQNTDGLNSTLNILNDCNINHIGAGKNIKEANSYKIFEKGGIKVAFYAVAEHEFSIASENSPGANPFDPLYTLDKIEEIKKLADYLIVLYHGGKEHYRYPSPNLQKITRRIVEKGADLVICQHSHTIGCEEKYQNSKIVYGQGNFIFDRSNNEHWKTSLLIELTFTTNMKVSYIPIIKNNNTIRIADEKKSKEIIDSFYKRSEEIKKKNFVENNWRKYCSSLEADYLGHLIGLNRYLAKINEIFKNIFLNIYLDKNKKLKILNLIECEAHKEIIETILKRKKKK